MKNGGMGGQGVPASRREPVVDPADRVLSANERELSPEMAKLRGCVEELRAALRREGIEEHTPLGVWGKAQESAIMALGLMAEMQTVRIEDRAEAFGRAWKSGIEHMAKAAEGARHATSLCHAQTAQIEAQAKANGASLALELAAGIKKELKETILVREIKWNRRQNWSAASLLAAVMIGCFVGGGFWISHRADASVRSRCEKAAAVSLDGRIFCSMDVVRGGS